MPIAVIQGLPGTVSRRARSESAAGQFEETAPERLRRADNTWWRLSGC